MQKVRNALSLRPNSDSTAVVVRSREALNAERAGIPSEEPPQGLASPQQYSEGAREAEYSMPFTTI